MSIVFYVMVISGIALMVSLVLFRAESVRRKRVLLASWRQRADAYLDRDLASFGGVRRVMGASSLRLFLHYVLHQFLSAGIFLINFTEKHLHILRAKNKTVAKDIRSKNEDGHLSHIAKHKSEVALSPEEEQRLKEQFIRD